MAMQANITDKGKRNPQPWTLPKAERSYYVHGLHGAKTATLAGSYGTKTEAMKAARRLANEEGEDVSISVPKGAMIVVHPNPAIRKNLFGFGKGKDARRTTPAHGGIAYHQGKMKGRPAAPSKSKGKAKAGGASAMPDEAALQAGFKRGLSLSEMLRQNPGWKRFVVVKRGENYYIRDRWHSEDDLSQRFGTKARAQVEADKANAKKNPAAASAEVFEEFHGFAPSEVVTVSKKVHHHAHLAALGTLVQLDVYGVDERGHKVQGFKGALLACNESRDQLFIEGGDQSINLKDFGIRGAHEMETLGRVTNIGYKTNKTHLGDEGGEAVYVHRFRATNQNGKHVVVKMTREPDLIYDVRNEQLLFSGGSYEILREGINK
jgi:hypothetical protein